jgi:hypothetical protein
MRTLPGTAVDRLLTAFLLVAPIVYLAADTVYTIRGWNDPTAAVLHVLGAIAYTLVLIRVLVWADGALAAAILLVGAIGIAGNVAYGFNTIHVSLGDTDLVDATGAATLIKPIGLCFPVLLLLSALALRRTAARWAVVLLAVAALAWPVAHIANIGWLAVAVNVGLVVAFADVARGAARTTRSVAVQPAG